MAEIFGAVAAGVAVGSELIRLGCAIEKRIRRIRDSRKDIEKLANETIIFAGLYKRFLSACNDDREAHTTDAPAINSLISWAQKTVDSLNTLLQKVDDLYPQSKPRSQFEDKAIAYLVWYSNTRTVKALRASLSVARESINGFSNLMCLEKLKDQLKTLKKVLHDPSKRRALEKQLGVKVEERIREINRDIADSEVIHKESMKMRDEAKEKVIQYQKKSQTSDDVPSPHELSEFTEVLNDYARELLPPRQPRHRTYRSSPGSSASRSGSAHSLVSHPSQSSISTSTDSSGVNRQRTTVLGSRKSSSSSSTTSSRSVPFSPARRTSPTNTLLTSGNIPDIVLPLNLPPRAAGERRSAGATECIDSPGGNTTTNPSTSTTPITSRHTSIATPTSVSSNSNTPENIAEPRRARGEDYQTTPATDPTIERPRMRGRDYMNDPNGTILSPPIVKDSDTSVPQRKEARVGQHLIILTSTNLTVNGHSLGVNNYELGMKFFETLTRHPDKLDMLDQALRDGLEDWEGIPEWVVRPTKVAEQPGATGAHDA